MSENETAEEERTDDEAPEDDETSEGGETSEDSESSEETETSDDGEKVETTAPGEWERQPSDEDDLRHDDGSEPLAEPSDENDDDLAEQEAGDVKAGDDDEDSDRPETTDEAGLEDTGGALEKHSEPLLEGSGVKTPVGDLPGRSLLAMLAFVVIFCAAFFGLWAALGNIGILLGIIVGVALGLGAMKLLADRAA